MRKQIITPQRVMLMLLLTVCLLTGCSRGGKAAKHAKNDQIAGFLFHFDQREETKALVAQQEKGKLPVQVTWRIPDEKNAAGRETMTEGETDPAAGSVTSEDPELISELYTALSNVIVMGNAVGHVEDRQGYISFTLTDGQECRFDFPTGNVIQLSRHYYSVETDGKLWGLLTGKSSS